MTRPYISYEEFYTDGDAKMQSVMESTYQQDNLTNQTFWQEADLDTRCCAGDTEYWADIFNQYRIPSSKHWNFNQVQRIVNTVAGYQSRNRKSIQVIPQENADQETADQYTKVLSWAFDKDHMPYTFSSAFRGMITTGMSMLAPWMDYREDPISGNLRVDYVAYNEFMIDSYFRNPDLSDCNYIWRRKWLTKEQVESLLPGREKDIARMQPLSNSDGKFNLMPESFMYAKTNLLTWDEYYYRTMREQELLIDRQTGETREWHGTKEMLDVFLARFPSVQMIKHHIPTVHLAISVNGIVMYNGPQPTGLDAYPFVPMLGYFQPNLPDFSKKCRGIVRDLRDPQFLYNRRMQIMLDILESQLNSGWIYKENALVNPSDVFLSGQGKGLALKEEASMSDVSRIPAAEVGQSGFASIEKLGSEIQSISGVNEELLGSAVDDKAGILSALRQGAGLTTLQIFFDNADFALKQLGKLCLKLVQDNFTPGKVRRILNEEPAPQFYDKAFGTYDAIVTQGFDTQSQQQMEFVQLVQLRELGVPVPSDVLVQAATLQNKNDLIKGIQAQEQQQAQVQQVQMQMAMQKAQNENTKAQASAEADRGLALERASRVQENRALAIERLNEADKDRDLGTLHIVRALKELQGMDLDNLMKQLAILQGIQGRQDAEEFRDQQQVVTPNLEEMAVIAKGETNEV